MDESWGDSADGVEVLPVRVPVFRRVSTWVMLVLGLYGVYTFSGPWPGTFCLARERARKKICLNNLRQIAVATTMYAQDHRETLPGSLDDLHDYLGFDWHYTCLTAPSSAPLPSYGYHRALAGLPVSRIAAPQAALVTADTLPRTWVITSERDLDYRHLGEVFVSFLDGHADRYSRRRMETVVFSPRLLPE
ncbi:MAG: DUF1559 family PulG-like putative transporter [Armatimonadota bacterium]